MPNWNRVNNELSQAVVDADRLDDLLEELGLRFDHHPGGFVYRGRCPIHLGNDKNFEMKVGGHTLPVRWRCYSHHCEEGDFKGNLLGLVRGVLSDQRGRKASMRDAVEFISKFTGGTRPCGRARPRTYNAPPPNLLCLTREQVRGQLVIPSPYFLGRGFSPAVLDALDVGHSVKLGRSVVPVYDDVGRTCVGFLSRSEKLTCPQCEMCHQPGEGCGKGERRWKFPAGFPKGDYVYGFAQAFAHPAPFVLLVEGPGHVFRAAEAGLAAVAAFGSGLSDRQIDKLRALNKELLIVFDTDDAGVRGASLAQQYLRELGVTCRTAQVPHPYTDLGEVPTDAVVEWARGVVPC